MLNTFSTTSKKWLEKQSLVIKASESTISPAQSDSRHRHPRDTADAPPFLPTVTVTCAAIFILLLLLWSLTPITAVTAAVVYEEGKNHQEGDNESDGW